MKSIEKIEKVTAAISNLATKFAELEKGLAVKLQEQEKLDDEALRAEILEQENWEAKKEAARKNREKIKEIKEEIERKKRAKELYGEERKSNREEALKEIRAEYGPIFEQRIKEFLKKARQAEKAEQAVRAVREEANKLVYKIGCYGRGALPFVINVLIEKDGDRPEYGPLNLFIKDCKQQGIDIDE